MPKIFDNMDEEQQEAAKAYAKENKIDLTAAAGIIKATEDEEERKEMLATFKAAAKSTPEKVAVAEQIKKAQAEYDALDKEYQAAKSQPISAMNRSLVAIKNDMHKKSMELKQLQAQA